MPASMVMRQGTCGLESSAHIQGHVLLRVAPSHLQELLGQAVAIRHKQGRRSHPVAQLNPTPSRYWLVREDTQLRMFGLTCDGKFEGQGGQQY
jgi:hypothetical protein